jgi:hypothetical protein
LNFIKRNRPIVSHHALGTLPLRLREHLNGNAAETEAISNVNVPLTYSNTEKFSGNSSLFQRAIIFS